MSYFSFEIILIPVKNIIPIITVTLILNYLNNSERSLVKPILIEEYALEFSNHHHTSRPSRTSGAEPPC